MIKFYTRIKNFSRFFQLYLNNFKNLSRYKDHTTINALANGKIIPVEQHTSFQVKHNMMNAKFNILISDGAIHAPFDCEVIDISNDYSTIILKSKEAYNYAIYLDKSANYLVKDNQYLALKVGTQLYENQNFLNINIDQVYANGYLPIISFCIFQDFDYTKVFYGKATACTTPAFIYF